VRVYSMANSREIGRRGAMSRSTNTLPCPLPCPGALLWLLRSCARSPLAESGRDEEERSRSNEPS
jgi:hypothetical protein